MPNLQLPCTITLTLPSGLLRTSKQIKCIDCNFVGLTPPSSFFFFFKGINLIPFSMCLFRVISFLFSHNTKTTSWLDPRLAKKAKPPEECKENGRSLSSYDVSALHFERVCVSKRRVSPQEAAMWLRQLERCNI